MFMYLRQENIGLKLGKLKFYSRTNYRGFVANIIRNWTKNLYNFFILKKKSEITHLVIDYRNEMPQKITWCFSEYTHNIYGNLYSGH